MAPAVLLRAAKSKVSFPVKCGRPRGLIRAATAQVGIPAAGGRLLELLRGVEGGTAACSPTFSERLTRTATLPWLYSMGFPKDYFHGAFLAGAAGALQHAAAETLPGLQVGEPTSETTDADNLVEAALRRRWADACSSLADEGLALLWNIEEVSALELGEVNLVFGMRRSAKPPAANKGVVRTSLAGHRMVLRPAEGSTQVTWNDIIACQQHGATVSAEVLLSARQTVLVCRSDDRSSILAAHYTDAAIHCLRLEAELEADAQATAGDGKFWKLNFDEDRGWLVSDINRCLGGNCVAEAIPSLS